MQVLGIDIGGSNVKVGLVLNRKIIKKWHFKTNPKNLFENIIDNLKDLNWNQVNLVGISIPGFVDHQSQIVIFSGNLQLKKFDVKKAFNNALKKTKKVYVLNDANAATLGEYWCGAGANYQSIVFYTIGTGIGGGVVIDGKLVDGKDGYAGEFGHGGYFQNQVDCNCGLKHCIEPVSSATGIEKALLKVGFKNSIKEIGPLFKKGDPKVLNVFKKALEPLANHIATIETALNPEAIIIGGGPSALGPGFVKIIKQLVAKNQLDFIANSTKILLAKTSNDAGIYGAVFWALESYKKET